MASLPPLAETVRADLGLSNAWMGVLTTLPVLCMGLLAPVANQLGRRLGAASAVGAGVGLVLVGLVLRGVGNGTVWSLYAGTLVAGAGIALAGTLLPGIVKAVFPAHRAGLGTGLTMMSMMGGAALASALSVPLAGALGGWSTSLLAWAPLAAVAGLVWIPVARHARRLAANRPVPEDVSHALPWRSPTAWLLAAYLSFQSWQFYSSLAWLAPTYESGGWSARDAGLLMSVFTGAQLVSGLVAPVLLDRRTDARVLLVGATLLGGLGEAGVWLAPDAAPWLWAVMIGGGQGACFALGLGLLVRYAATARDSARLTAMGFLVSYTVASAGPATMGAVRDASGGYTWLWAVLALVGLPQLLASSRLRPDADRVGTPEPVVSR
ncbi:MFS transporter [Phycicoccus sp. MQZ13P-5]|uniref:MFS transporter n=2 Tax=Phycicoccus sonneratiae TaxID=2807628 RepID=A0ABS2CHW4_9MICO|nr:MFS transporter [Phycicoccus sonneraticus]